MAEAAVPGRSDQVRLSVACLERQLPHDFWRLVLTPMDKDHRNSKASFFFPDTAGNVTPDIILPPH